MQRKIQHLENYIYEFKNSPTQNTLKNIIKIINEVNHYTFVVVDKIDDKVVEIKNKITNPKIYLNAKKMNNHFKFSDYIKKMEWELQDFIKQCIFETDIIKILRILNNSINNLFYFINKQNKRNIENINKDFIDFLSNQTNNVLPYLDEKKEMYLWTINTNLSDPKKHLPILNTTIQGLKKQQEYNNWINSENNNSITNIYGVKHLKTQPEIITFHHAKKVLQKDIGNEERLKMVDKLLISVRYFRGMLKMGEDQRYLFEKSDDVLLQGLFILNMFRNGVNMRQHNKNGGMDVLFLPNVRNFGINEKVKKNNNNRNDFLSNTKKQKDSVDGIYNFFYGKSKETLQQNFNEMVQNIGDIEEMKHNRNNGKNNKIIGEILKIMKQYQNKWGNKFSLAEMLENDVDRTRVWTNTIKKELSEKGISTTHLNLIQKYKNTLLANRNLISHASNSNHFSNNEKKQLKVIVQNNNKNKIIKGHCPNFLGLKNTKTECNIQFKKDMYKYPLLLQFSKNDDGYDINSYNELSKNNTKRQFVYGTYPEINYMRNCSEYFRNLGFDVDNKIKKAGLLWNQDINEAWNFCVSNEKMIFPVRFLIPSTKKFRNFTTNDHEFLGNVIVPFNDDTLSLKIKHLTQFFSYNIFYNNIPNPTDENIVLITQLSGYVYSPYIMQSPRITYSELRHFLEMFNMKLYKFSTNENIKTDPNYSNILYFLSKYNSPELLKKYPKYSKLIMTNLQEMNVVYPPRHNDMIIRPIAFIGGYNIDDKYIFYKKIISNDITHTISYKISEIPTLYSENVYPLKYYKKVKSMENDIIKIISHKSFFLLKKKIYLYDYIFSNEIQQNNRSVIYNNKKSNNKKIFYWLNDHSKNILFHHFYNNKIVIETLIDFSTFHYIKTKNKILHISKNSADIEALMFYNEKQNIKTDICIHSFILELYAFMDKYNKTEQNKLKNIYKINTNYIKNFSFFKNIKKNIKNTYDTMFLSTYIYYDGIGTVKDNLNQQLLFTYVIIILQNLNVFGNVILILSDLKTQLTANLIYFISKYFKKSFLFSRKISITATINSSYGIYLEDFQISDTERENVLEKLYKINDEWFKLDPSGGKNFNIRDPKLRKEFDITREIENHHITEYVNSVIEIKDPKINEFYKMLFDYSTEKLKIYEKTLQDIEYYYNEVCVKKNKEVAEYFRERQLFESISLANSLNLRLKPNLDQEAFADHFGKSLLADMFSIDNAYKYQFEKHNCSNVDIDVKCCEEPLEFFKQNKIDFWQSQRVIDTRDPDKYNKIKKKVMYYKQNLSNYIFDNYNVDVNTPNPPARVATQAWCKMYEILETYKSKIFTKNKITKSMNVLKNGGVRGFPVFHLCEAPGAFILATNHFIKTKTKIKNYDWGAQSLNSNRKNKKNNEPNGLKDGLGLMKKYPDRWHFGGDNTGDITKVENIKSYKPICSNAELMTADCGLDWKLRHSGKYEGMLDFAMFLFILNNLKSGGNTIIKVYYPLTNMKISLIYLFYRVFKELHIYKPIQNLGSEEVYLIGIDYKKKRMTKNNLEDMYKILRKYRKQEFGNEKKTPNMSLFPISKILQKFILQLEKVSKQIHYDFDNNIARKIYYVDNEEKISNKHYEELKEQIQTKVVRWCEKYKLKKIKDSDNL
jgi:hypothetical protein